MSPTLYCKYDYETNKYHLFVVIFFKGNIPISLFYTINRWTKQHWSTTMYQYINDRIVGINGLPMPMRTCPVWSHRKVNAAQIVKRFYSSHGRMAVEHPGVTVGKGSKATDQVSNPPRSQSDRAPWGTLKKQVQSTEASSHNPQHPIDLMPMSSYQTPQNTPKGRAEPWPKRSPKPRWF